MADHKLCDHKPVIQDMRRDQCPVISERETWNKEKFHRLNEGIAKFPSQFFFNGDESLRISREDLFKLAEPISESDANPSDDEIHEFIYATTIWGYPAGGRGKNIEYLLETLGGLTVHLKTLAREREILCWKAHLDELHKMKEHDRIKGVGISTYTKFLYFLGVKVETYPSLILDSKLERVFNAEIFREFELRIDNDRKYSDYLEVMNKVADDLGVKPDQLEMFLFHFGASLMTQCTAS